METIRTKQILGQDKAKESVNTDSYLKINLESKSTYLPTDSIDKIIDTGVRFNQERQRSSIYRILGTINPTISNPLFNLTGTDSWSTFNTVNFTTGVLTLAESIKKNLYEIDGWFGYFDPIENKVGLCDYFDMEPKRERFYFTTDITNIPNVEVKNWDITITYPYSTDKTHPMVNGGLLIVEATEVTIGGKQMVAIGLPVLHNVVAGDTIRLSGTSIDGDYNVIRLGLDNGDLKDYYVCIDVPYTVITLGTQSRFIKLVNGNPSEYYFRIFKKVKTKDSSLLRPDDYEVYKLAFSENIYTDSIFQFVFNDDVDVSGLVDNLNRPISELYLTHIKTNSNNIFTSVSSGIEVPPITNLNSSVTNTYLRDVPAVQKIHNGGSLPFPTHIPLETNLNVTADTFYGDVVQYNTFEVLEVVLGEVHHRFNTLNRETAGTLLVGGPRQEGYYYKAHQLIRIRDFSNYVEQGDSKTVGMPDYVVDLGDGRFLWRDLLDIGITDSKPLPLNYPFTNGAHYMYNNYGLSVKRQDPFDQWDLFYKTFPADPIGNTMTNNFTVNSANDVC